MRARALLALSLALAGCGGAGAAPPFCTDPTCPPDGGSGADRGPAGDAGPADGFAASDVTIGGVPGLVASYAFDEAAGTVALDSSGNFNNGGLLGAIDRGTGHEGGDASLRGGYVLLPPSLLNGATEATLAAWVKVRTNTQAWQRVFDFGSGMGQYMFLTVRSTSNTLRFAISRNGSANEELIEAPALPLATWKHVAVVLGAAGGVLYVDGMQAGTNPGMTLRPTDISPMTNDWLGRSEYSYDPSLDGELDDVRVYSRALGASEIAALFSGP
jgi:hypothetical protein